MAGVVGFGVGWVQSRSSVEPKAATNPESDEVPVYSSGVQTKDFYDLAYETAQGNPVTGAISGLSAHHLIIPDSIAEVFEDLASSEVKTVVLVSPNHFKRGQSVAQVSEGSWTTPYGQVDSDVGAIDELLKTNSTLKHEEVAYGKEHGIYGLTPFVKKSFPNAKIVSIILDDRLSAADAWQLGQEIATKLPNAVLVASVDMTHYREAEYTAANDEKVLKLLADAGMCDDVPCTDELDIDSNSSMRVLFGFNEVHGTQRWQLTHHGSSLAMGATTDWHDNTSHILGYFLPNR